MDGILIINKPQGYTSHDIVNIVKKALNTPKVGHTGTLDPNATGVLPILIGKATKVSKYLIEHNKTYVAELALGEKSSTGDTEGEIIEKKKVPLLNEEQIKQVLKSFEGKQMQTPPIYSSIKINGKKAYEYARKGQIIQLEPRPIEIMKISFIKFENNVLKYEVQCSKGTYIRTLCEDISQKLGTVGYMEELQRTKVNTFKIEDSILLDDITLENAEKNIIKIEKVFKEKDKINLDNKKLEMFLNGVKLTYSLSEDIYRIYNNEHFIGIGILKNGLLKRDIVI